MIMFFAKNNDDYEYIYDPDHKKRPGGGYRKTEKGWAKGDFTRMENPPVQHIDMSKGREVQDNGFIIDESQLNDEVVITDENGRTRKYGEMSEDEKNVVKKTIKLCKSFSSKGFSDYSKVDAETFHSNMKRNLDFVDTGIPEAFNKSTQRLNRNNVQHFESSLREHLGRLRDKYAPAVKSKYAKMALDKYTDKILDVIKQGIDDGTLSDMKECDLDKFIQDDMKRLIYLEMETRRRSMGDHGIRHLVGNAVNTVDILSELKKNGISNGTTARDMLTGMICQVNHDTGYAVGSVATDGKDGTYHKSHSGIIAEQEYSRYEQLLGKEHADMLVGRKETYSDGVTHKRKAVGLNDPKLFEKAKPVLDDSGNQKTNKNGEKLWSGVLKEEVVKNLKPTDKLYQQSKEFSSDKVGNKGMIPYHDEANYNWKDNALRSAVALADCTALFGKDKVQELFLESDEAMEDTVKMHTILSSNEFTTEQKQNAFGKYKTKLKKIVSQMNATELDKQMLVSQIEEASSGIKSFNTVKDILTRASGSLNGFKYDAENGKMIVNTSFSRAGEVLENMFGNKFVRSQFDKAAKGDFGGIQAKDVNDGNARTVYGKPGGSVEISIGKMINNEIDSQGVQRADKALPQRSALRELAKIGAYGTDEQISAKMSEYNSKAKDSNGKSGKKSKGEIIFGSNWEKVRELVSRGDYDGLKDIPLSEEEKVYLMGAFASRSKYANAIFNNGSSSRACRIAFRIARKHIMADYVFTKKVTVLGTDYMFVCQSDGEVTLYDKKKNSGWTVISELFEKDNGIEYLRNLVRKNYELFETRKIDEWFRKTGLKWKKKY